MEDKKLDMTETSENEMVMETEEMAEEVVTETAAAETAVELGWDFAHPSNFLGCG